MGVLIITSRFIRDSRSRLRVIGDRILWAWHQFNRARRWTWEYCLSKAGWVALCCGILGVGSAAYFLYKLSNKYTVWGTNDIEITNTGAVGDFIGGVVGTILSFASLLMVLKTYRDQKRDNEKDKKEARIFNLLQIHINNADSITYNNPYKT